jgi:hypothetical protein
MGAAGKLLTGLGSVGMGMSGFGLPTFIGNSSFFNPLFGGKGLGSFGG